MSKWGTHHFTLDQLRNIFIKYELTLHFDFSLLPNRMLSEELICSCKCCIMENVRIAFEHVPDSRSKFRKSCIPFFLLLGFQRVGELREHTLSTRKELKIMSSPRTFCQALFFSASVFKALYNGSVMIVLIV